MTLSPVRTSTPMDRAWASKSSCILVTETYGSCSGSGSGWTPRCLGWIIKVRRVKGVRKFEVSTYQDV